MLNKNNPLFYYSTFWPLLLVIIKHLLDLLYLFRDFCMSEGSDLVLLFNFGTCLVITPEFTLVIIF